MENYIIYLLNLGIYTLPPVPEAAEYEVSSSSSSDNTSSSASTLNEDIQNIETEYQFEHGKINSFAKKSKKFCQVS